MGVFAPALMWVGSCVAQPVFRWVAPDLKPVPTVKTAQGEVAGKWRSTLGGFNA